jgi:putative DNA base modification enzyme with NMAD domain
MSDIYFYKLTCDDGGAPCVRNGLLSLAICKPFIRMGASVGDFIFGFAANSLRRDNCLIYIARVTSKLTDGKYYEIPRYQRREDCVYQFKDSRFEWRAGSKHHSQEDLVHDLGKPPCYKRSAVLLSNDFRYLGDYGTADYKNDFPEIRNVVEHLAIGFRHLRQANLYGDFDRLKADIWQRFRRNVVGRPIQRPSRNACHRSRSCGSVLATVVARD